VDTDDLPVGTVLTRRRALTVLGAAGFAAAKLGKPLSAQTAAGPLVHCIARPESIEGPYFLDKRANRQDIRVESSSGAISAGVLLTLGLTVSALNGGKCSPLPAATIDVWQCDALGVYSGVADPLFGAESRALGFLRGYQRTGTDGTARFLTIYPGWYTGRAVHLHFKIRTEGADRQAYEFTSQLYFPESLTDQIHAQAPYSQRKRRDMTNDRDSFFKQGGDRLMLQPIQEGQGYAAMFGIALDLSDTQVGRPDGRGGRGRGF
jgi:protocatechuate 3,4-dioxygenase beta subunit